ncbi:MAG: hypothetical protein BalsKO_02940 [Balneolaceae bacterium]
MIKNYWIAKSIVIFALVLLCFNNAQSHPWGGLVIDEHGDIYFTFICPIVDDDHYACVWKIDSNNELTQILKSSYSPSDIVLSRSNERDIFAAERTGGSPNYNNSLWRINGHETLEEISSSTNQRLFFIQAFAVSNNGILYFARENKLYSRDRNNTISEIILPENIGRIQLMELGTSEELYLLAGNNLYLKNKNESLRLIKSDLKEKNPENLPFRGANIFFDMAIDDRGSVYLAYYGDRKVIEVTKDGILSVVLEAKAPWSPHRVDLYEGNLYVLESTLGNGAWWKFWDTSDDAIIPRIRRLDKNGKVSEIFIHSSN